MMFKKQISKSVPKQIPQNLKSNSSVMSYLKDNTFHSGIMEITNVDYADTYEIVRVRTFHGSLLLYYVSMMEKPDACKCHRNIIFITYVNNVIISNRTACLSHIAHSALSCSFNIITKGEKCV